jgi:polyisoprenoid-binding protein YceI
MTHLWLTLLLGAVLPANAGYTADPGASTIRYTIVHKLHDVEAISREIEAKAVVKEDGSVLAMVRVPVAAFRSGDANRDEHMLEAVEAGKYPFVVFKGIAQLGPAREVSPGRAELRGQVDLHGVSTPITVPLELDVQSDGAVRARGRFQVSLDEHRVERPSLLFVKIDDTCRIDFDLVLRGDR